MFSVGDGGTDPEELGTYLQQCLDEKFTKTNNKFCTFSDNSQFGQEQLEYLNKGKFSEISHLTRVANCLTKIAI